MDFTSEKLTFLIVSSGTNVFNFAFGIYITYATGNITY